MKDKINRFIEKHSLSPDDIIYIIRDRSKTCIYLTDGKVIETYFSMKNILSAMDAEELICINKGAAISCTKVISIENGIYTMCDGRTIRGRVRTPGEHKRIGAKVKAKSAFTDIAGAHITPDSIPDRFAILDRFPVPFAVFELIYGDDGVPTDILFRYLNDAMAEIAGSSPDNTMNRSFYDVFENGDKKWMEINAEVASVLGDARSIRRFSPELGRYLSLYYYCPLTGFCACALI